VYHRGVPKALNTPLTQLRRDAPGSITQADVSAFMKERGLDLETITIGDFERGKYQPADPRFIPLYAKRIGATQAAVRRAYEKTRKAR